MMNLEQITAELRLFKAYTIDEKIRQSNNTLSSLQSGILYTNDVSNDVKKAAEDLYGLKPEDWNRTFHKSFQTILDTPIEVLIAQQIVHYITTYGLEALDLYNADTVYIPYEKLEIPELEENVKLQVIRKITETGLNERLMTLLTSGIALSKQTIADVMVLSDFINKDEFDKIKNREVKIALYDKYNVVPSNNMEFLRYVVYKITGSTLYIQNKAMIHTIKSTDKTNAYKYFSNYVSKSSGYIELAKIFLRNKNIFLAFKTNSPEHIYEKSLNTIINKISKNSKKYHQPLTTNILDTLSNINTIKEVNANTENIINALDNVTVFRELRIINGLRFRLRATSDKTNSIVYRVRNGKAYATEFKPMSSRTAKAVQIIYDIVYNHLINRIKPIFENKNIYIPNIVQYAVPTSEKQFVGNMPEGSTLTVPRNNNMVIGVHWTNLANKRVDLDLKLLNKNSAYGWDASYYSNSGDIVFSGDVTDAQLPNGATEAFLITPNVNAKSFLLTLNDFTQVKEEIPFELFISSLDNASISKNYMVDPNTVQVLFHNKFENTDKSKPTSSINLGFVQIDTNEVNIQFKNFETIKGSVNNPNEVNKRIYDYTNMYSEAQLTLNELLKDSGANIVNSSTVEKLESVDVNGETLYKKVLVPVDIDLSIENITKDTFIDMFNIK